WATPRRWRMRASSRRSASIPARRRSDVPFDFLKRKKWPDTAHPPPATSARTPGVAFDGLTEDWRLTGTMMIDGRLSDALNKREPIDIERVQWGPVGGSHTMGPTTRL